MASLGEAYVELGVRDQNLIRGLNRAQQKLEGYNRSIQRVARRAQLATAALSGSIMLLTQRSAKYADEVMGMVKQTGIAAESIQALGFAAQQSNSDMQTLQRGLRSFGRRAAEAARGNKQQLEGFERLGVQLTDNEGRMRTMEDLLMDVADATKELGSEAEMSAALMRVMGDTGRRLVPFMRQGADSIDELMQKARELGIVTSEQAIRGLARFNDESNRLRGQVTALGREIAVQFVGPLTVLNEYLSAGIQHLRSLDQETRDTITRVVMFGGVVLSAVSVLGVLATGLLLSVKAFSALGAIVGVVTSPIVMALAGVAAGAYVLYTAWEQNWLGVRDLVTSVWERYLQPTFDAIRTRLDEAWDWAIDTGGDVWEWLTDTTWVEKIEDVKRLLDGVWDWAIETAKDAWEWLDDGAPWVTNVLEYVYDLLSTVWSWGIETARDAWRWLADTDWVQVIHNVGDALADGWEWMISTGGGAWDWFLSTTLVEWLQNLSRTLTDTRMWRWTVDVMWPEAGERVRAWWDDVREAWEQEDAGVFSKTIDTVVITFQHITSNLRDLMSDLVVSSWNWVAERVPFMDEIGGIGEIDSTIGARDELVRPQVDVSDIDTMTGPQPHTEPAVDPEALREEQSRWYRAYSSWYESLGRLDRLRTTSPDSISKEALMYEGWGVGAGDAGVGTFREPVTGDVTSQIEAAVGHAGIGDLIEAIAVAEGVAAGASTWEAVMQGFVGQANAEHPHGRFASSINQRLFEDVLEQTGFKEGSEEYYKAAAAVSAQFYWRTFQREFEEHAGLAFGQMGDEVRRLFAQHMGSGFAPTEGANLRPAELELNPNWPGHVYGNWQSGTSWTGSGGRDQVAGVVHHQEAVIPADALRKGPAGVLEFLGVPGYAEGRLAPGIAAGEMPEGGPVGWGDVFATYAERERTVPELFYTVSVVANLLSALGAALLKATNLIKKTHPKWAFITTLTKGLGLAAGAGGLGWSVGGEAVHNPVVDFLNELGEEAERFIKGQEGRFDADTLGQDLMDHLGEDFQRSWRDQNWVSPEARHRFEEIIGKEGIEPLSDEFWETLIKTQVKYAQKQAKDAGVDVDYDAILGEGVADIIKEAMDPPDATWRDLTWRERGREAAPFLMALNDIIENFFHTLQDLTKEALVLAAKGLMWFQFELPKMISEKLGDAFMALFQFAAGVIEGVKKELGLPSLKRDPGDFAPFGDDPNFWQRLLLSRSMMGWQSGTPWTGSGPVDQPAGIVHHQEAVIPADALRMGPAGVLDFLGMPGFQSGRLATGAGGGGPTAPAGRFEALGDWMLEQLEGLIGEDLMSTITTTVNTMTNMFSEMWHSVGELEGEIDSWQDKVDSLSDPLDESAESIDWMAKAAQLANQGLDALSESLRGIGTVVTDVVSKAVDIMHIGVSDSGKLVLDWKQMLANAAQSLMNMLGNILSGLFGGGRSRQYAGVDPYAHDYPDIGEMRRAVEERDENIRRMREIERNQALATAGGAAVGGGVGAGIGFAVGGPIGAAVGGIFGALFGGSAAKGASKRAYEQEIAELEEALETTMEDIRRMLGTSMTDVANDLQRAFSARNVEDFVEDFGQMLGQRIEQALVQAFMTGEAMAPLIESISDQVTEIALTGDISEIDEIYDLIEEAGDQFEVLLPVLEKLRDELGYMEETVGEVNEQLHNVPSGFKIALERFDAARPERSSYGGFLPRERRTPSPDSEAFIPREHTDAWLESRHTGGDTIIVQGDVYGYDDFEHKVQQATSSAGKKRRTAAYGGGVG